MSKKKSWMTAAELVDRLSSDPVWVRKKQKRQARHAARAAQLRAELEPEEGPLLIALRTVGCNVNSVWDLKDTKPSYPAAIPILIKFLATAHHPVLRQGIARALTVKEARGLAGHQLLQELMAKKDPRGSEERWTLANALTVAWDISLVDEIRALVADPDYADVHELLMESLKSLRAE